MKRLYIIAGCNGAGKTTASYIILPEMLECDEFVNADEIAKGLSPFNPEKEAIRAGRLMLDKINRLLEKEKDFAFETTLATKSFKNFIEKARDKGYKVVLLFFWLRKVELAVKRVEVRVKEGGHDIPEKVIKRRYDNGLKNFYSIYKDLVEDWMFIDNSGEPYELIAESNSGHLDVLNEIVWKNLQSKYQKK